jgi:hypothetical protein
MAKGAAVEGGGGEGVEVMCDATSRSSVPRLPARAAGAERLTMHAGGERPWAMHGVVLLARTDAKARWSWVRRHHKSLLVAFAAAERTKRGVKKTYVVHELLLQYRYVRHVWECMF